MMKWFRIAAERHALIKEAIPGLSALGSMAGAVGKAMIKNPMTTAGALLTGSEVAGAVAKSSGQVENARRGAMMAANSIPNGRTF
jgi:hypothetical protein